MYVVHVYVFFEQWKKSFYIILMCYITLFITTFYVNK